MSNNYLKRAEIERSEQWREIIEQIPALNFPRTWTVKVIPPFGGAAVRFLVSTPNREGRISIYLDFYDVLGFMQEPYWEVYPLDGDAYRCLLNEKDDLIKAISRAIRQLPIKKTKV